MTRFILGFFLGMFFVGTSVLAEEGYFDWVHTLPSYDTGQEERLLNEILEEQRRHNSQEQYRQFMDQMNERSGLIPC